MFLKVRRECLFPHKDNTIFSIFKVSRVVWALHMFHKVQNVVENIFCYTFNNAVGQGQGMAPSYVPQGREKSFLTCFQDLLTFLS